MVQAYNIQVVNNLSNRQNADNGLTTEKQGKKKHELEIVGLKMLRCSFYNANETGTDETWSMLQQDAEYE